MESKRNRNMYKKQKSLRKLRSKQPFRTKFSKRRFYNIIKNRKL